jgi:hypothetical protein
MVHFIPVGYGPNRLIAKVAERLGLGPIVRFDRTAGTFVVAAFVPVVGRCRSGRFGPIAIVGGIAVLCCLSIASSSSRSSRTDRGGDNVVRRKQILW